MNRAITLMGCLLAVAGCKKADVEPAEDDGSPPQHSDISPKPPKGCGGAFWSVHYGDAYKTLREAEEFKPKTSEYYVRELSDHRNEYLLAGISPNERKEWFASHKIAEKDVQCMAGIFDAIGAAAKRTLPKYRPLGYKQHDSAEEELIRNAVKEDAEISDADFLAVGVKQASWEIEKHSNGIPSSRYKYGMAWVKSKKFDDGYCRIVYVNIVGDYAGGESYTDSKGNYISMEPAGCR